MVSTGNEGTSSPSIVIPTLDPGLFAVLLGAQSFLKETKSDASDRFRNRLDDALREHPSTSPRALLARPFCMARPRRIKHDDLYTTFRDVHQEVGQEIVDSIPEELIVDPQGRCVDDARRDVTTALNYFINHYYVTSNVVGTNDKGENAFYMSGETLAHYPLSQDVVGHLVSTVLSAVNEFVRVAEDRASRVRPHITPSEIGPKTRNKLEAMSGFIHNLGKTPYEEPITGRSVLGLRHYWLKFPGDSLQPISHEFSMLRSAVDNFRTDIESNYSIWDTVRKAGVQIVGASHDQVPTLR